MTTDYDIGFGLYYKPGEMKDKELNVGDMAVVVSGTCNTEWTLGLAHYA